MGPDGYKSDDVYTPSALTMAAASAQPRASQKSRKKGRRPASSRTESRPALDPVEEHSADTERCDLQNTTPAPSNPDPKHTIEQIMNRGVQEKAPGKSKSRVPLSHVGDAGVARAHRIAKSLSQQAGRAGSDASVDRGPPTIGSNQEAEEEVVTSSLASVSSLASLPTLTMSGETKMCTEEHSIDTERCDSPRITPLPPTSNPKQTIEDIMNRGVEDKAPGKSKSRLPLSDKGDAGVARAHQPAKYFSQQAGRAGDDAPINRRPPAIDSHQEEEEVVKSSLASISPLTSLPTVTTSSEIKMCI